MSASCAIELGPRGITSNIIAPGPIDDTEGMERLSRAKDKDAARKKIPVGRGGKVKDIADATVYVLGDTGGFVNGQVLVGRFVPFILPYLSFWKGRSEVQLANYSCNRT